MGAYLTSQNPWKCVLKHAPVQGWGLSLTLQVSRKNETITTRNRGSQAEWRKGAIVKKEVFLAAKASNLGRAAHEGAWECHSHTRPAGRVNLSGHYRRGQPHIDDGDASWGWLGRRAGTWGWAGRSPRVCVTGPPCRYVNLTGPACRYVRLVAGGGAFRQLSRCGSWWGPAGPRVSWAGAPGQTWRRPCSASCSCSPASAALAATQGEQSDKVLQSMSGA